MSRRDVESEFRLLGLSTRTINALRAQDIFKITQLNEYTIRDVARFPGIGGKALDELKMHLSPFTPKLVPHTHSQVVSARLDPHTLTEMDKWSLDHGTANSRAETIRQLIELGLSTPLKRTGR